MMTGINELKDQNLITEQEMQELLHNFWMRIDEQIKERDLKLKDISAAMCISYRHFYKIRKSTSLPSFDAFLRMIYYIQPDLDYVFYGVKDDGEENSEQVFLSAERIASYLNVLPESRHYEYIGNLMEGIIRSAGSDREVN